MDIERLKELKEWVNNAWYSVINNAMSEYPDYYGNNMGRQDLLKLIDAEIARQSMTDEAVRDAISAIEHNMPTKGTYTILTEALHPAITALRQMWTEPCEWLLSCGYEEFEEHITECGVVFTFIGDEMKNIHYCPNCGRLVTHCAVSL